MVNPNFQMEPPELPNAYRDRAVDEANAWVARFAPLILEEQVLSESDVRKRIETIHQLRGVGPALRDRLDSVGGPGEQELTDTLADAIEQLDSVERDLRIRLARLSPGDPAGIVDLEALKDKLAERAARHEIGMTTELAQPTQLDLKISAGNKAAAAALGIFALGWNAFTAVHATFMIGGMFSAFGWPALALLAFYAIFFAAGGAMAVGALNAASTEEIRVDGLELTVIRKLGRWERRKMYVLAPDSRAEIGVSTSGFNTNNNRNTPKPAIILPDANGNEVTLGTSATDHQRSQAIARINAYLDSV
jgi:hypothetical protein